MVDSLVSQAAQNGQFNEAEVDDYVRRGLDHLWIHTQQYNDLAKPDGFMVLTEGEGVRLKDIKGRSYIDAMSGLWVVAVGHGRKELARVAAEQMEKLAYINTFAYATRPGVDLATKLAELAPGSISKFYFANSGSEAVETAIRMSKQYHYNRGDKKRYKIISRRGSYHGMTAGALSINGAQYANRAPFEPLLPGAIQVPGVNCYRCPYEKTYPECDVFCARTIEDTIKFEKPETVAAIVAEPISSANANFIPPAEYWPTLREICDKYGILLIADEVINGFGRTGKWFAIEHTPVIPDLMTVAKGISSGYLPISAVMAKQEVADAFVGEKSMAFSGGITFGTHPVSCAVALANIQIIEREGLVENARLQGDYMLEELRRLREYHPSIGEVRGIGLLIAVELVKNRETKEQFGEADDMNTKMTDALKKRGLLSRAGAMISLAPPLCINKQEVDEIVGIVDESIGEVEQSLGVK
ncbi:MAG TPA: aspartate aminotransferase family protein [Dehalococcoidia bacterium]|nr:aspartate aminotransferase family protein [Dehalococcoidia bacterium]